MALSTRLLEAKNADADGTRGQQFAGVPGKIKKASADQVRLHDRLAAGPTTCTTVTRALTAAIAPSTWTTPHCHSEAWAIMGPKAADITTLEALALNEATAKNPLQAGRQLLALAHDRIQPGPSSKLAIQLKDFSCQAAHRQMRRHQQPKPRSLHRLLPASCEVASSFFKCSPGARPRKNASVTQVTNSKAAAKRASDSELQQRPKQQSKLPKNLRRFGSGIWQVRACRARRIVASASSQPRSVAVQQPERSTS